MTLKACWPGESSFYCTVFVVVQSVVAPSSSQQLQANVSSWPASPIWSVEVTAKLQATAPVIWGGQSPTIGHALPFSTTGGPTSSKLVGPVARGPFCTAASVGEDGGTRCGAACVGFPLPRGALVNGRLFSVMMMPVLPVGPAVLASFTQARPVTDGAVASMLHESEITVVWPR